MFSRLFAAVRRQPAVGRPAKQLRKAGLMLGHRLNIERTPIVLSPEELRTHLWIAGHPQLGARMLVEQLLTQQIEQGGGWLFVDTQDDPALASRLAETAASMGRRMAFQPCGQNDLARLDVAHIFKSDNLVLICAPRLAGSPVVAQLRQLLEQGCMARLAGPRDAARLPFMCVLDSLPDYGESLSAVLPSQARAAGVSLVMTSTSGAHLGDATVFPLIAGNTVTKVFFNAASLNEAQVLADLSALSMAEQENLRMLPPNRFMVVAGDGSHLARLATKD